MYEKAWSVITSFRWLVSFQKSFISWSRFTCEFSHGCSRGALNIKSSVLHFFQCEWQACWRDKNNCYLPAVARSSVCLTTCRSMGRERGPQIHLATWSQGLNWRLKRFLPSPFTSSKTERKQKSSVFKQWFVPVNDKWKAWILQTRNYDFSCLRVLC